MKIPQEFDTIRPWEPEDLPEVFDRLLSNEQFKQVLAYLYPQVPFEMIAQKLKACKTNMEFQLAFAYDFVHGLLKKAATGCEPDCSAIDNTRNYTFISNTHYIASTGIGGATPVRHAAVGIDFLTVPNIKEEDKKYLQALDHLNPTHEYGVAFERGTRLTLPDKQIYFISGTASIDKHGQVMYEGDIVRQTGRLLENIGALLKDGGATMNDIQYFIIYLRDLSDHHAVEKMMQQFYPQIPHIIVEAKVCQPGWLIEMECIAEK